MNNPNHPLYSALGGGSNIHLLDNMLFTSEQHKPLINSQYMYTNMEQLAAHQHAMNLAVTEQSHIAAVNTASTTIDSSALLYHQTGHHQQQPISYKIPQVSTVLLQQQHQHHHPQTVAAPIPLSAPTGLHEKKKDILSEAMKEQKIFEEVPRLHEPLKKPEPRILTPVTTVATSQPAAINVPVAIKSEPPAAGANLAKAPVVKPSVSDPKPGTSSSAGSSSSLTANRGRGTGRVMTHQRHQQIVPRLQLLDDEDDGLTCRLCLQPFWYKSELHDHLKSTHSISDPTRYEREEREKKIRQFREHQRMALMRQQRGQSRGRGVTIGMTRGIGTIRGSSIRGRGMTNRMVPTGPRPSFQYRDGSFICDLCKKSFSDGNDMVAHWKLHVKQQQQQKAAGKHYMAYGRPFGKKQGGKRKKTKRKDKGKPRWTAYLLWSTRRRKQIANEHPGWSFAEVGKAISEEWKTVGRDQLEQLKEEAEEMNITKKKKLPKLTDSGEEDWSEEEDPSFDETNVKKPVIMKLENVTEVTGGSRTGRQRKRPSFFQDFENEENNLDKILDEFEQEQIEEAKNPRPKERKTPKNPGSRPRKRRTESYNEDDYSLPVELETTRSGRVRKKTRFFNFLDEEEEEESHSDDEDKDEYQPESEPEEPEEEFMDESEVEEEEEEESGEEGKAAGVKIETDSITLPPKKRRGSNAEEDDDDEDEDEDSEDLEEATKAALKAKPVVVGKKRRKLDEEEDDDDEEDEEEESTDSDDEGLLESDSDESDDDDDDERPVKRRRIKKEVKEIEPKNESKSPEPNDNNEGSVKQENPEPVPEKNEADGQNKTEESVEQNNDDEENDLEGSVTEEDPPETFFDGDRDTCENIESEEPPSERRVNEAGPGDVVTQEGNANTSRGEGGDDLGDTVKGTESVDTKPSEESANIEHEVDPFGATDTGPRPAEDEELLTATSTSEMEAGDKEYKDMIAESQLENIFN